MTDNTIGGYDYKMVREDFTPELKALYHSIQNKELINKAEFLIADIREPTLEIYKKHIETISKNCDNDLDKFEIMLIALLYEIRKKRFST